MADASIKAVITAEDRASGVLKEFAKNTDSVGSAVLGTAKIAAEALVGAGVAAVGFATLSLKAFSEAQEQTAQLNQVLQTTGKVSTISSAYVEQLAGSMEKYSGKTRDSIMQGQVLLLQFAQTTKQNLPEMTKAMLDLSQRMGVDSITAAKSLGIALDDPATGMNRLRRSGIDFTEAQKETIKALQKSGDISGADAILMKALEEKVGGAAGAYRETLPGAIESAKASLHDFEVQVGGTIAQYLEPLAAKAANTLAAIDWQKVIQRTIDTLKDWQQELDKVWQKIDKVYQAIEHYLAPKLETLWSIIQTSFPVFRKFVDEYLNPLAEVLAITAGKSLVWAIGKVIEAASLLLIIATPIFKFLDNNKVVVYTLAAAFGTLMASMAFDAAFNAITVGFQTLTLVTIPSLQASLAALSASFYAAMPYAVVGAFVIWFGTKMDQIKHAYDDMFSHISGVSADAQRIQNQAIADFKAGKITKEQETKILQIAAAESDSVVHHAGGGSFPANKPIIVGEKGPELLVPSNSGSIVPNNQLGGGTVNITIQSQAFMGSQIEARQFAQQILGHLNDLATQKNTTVAKMVGI